MLLNDFIELRTDSKDTWINSFGPRWDTILFLLMLHEKKEF